MDKTAVAAAILVAACGNEKSLAIQIVTTDSSITTIELFVGDTSCDTCAGVAPPSSVDKPTGPVEYTGQGARFEAAVGPGGVAGFRLEPSVNSATVAKLAAVGFTANGTPRGFVLDDAGFSVDALQGTVRRYTLAEQTILRAQGPRHGADPTDQIIVWRAPNAVATTPSCLAIEHRDGTNEFLVPPGDPDCDGFIANECDPDWYDYASNTATPCLTQPTPASACVVGSEAGCTDGTANTCAPGARYCLPERACASPKCGLFDGPGCLAELVPDPADLTSPVAALRCTVQLATNRHETCQAITTVVLSAASSCNPGFASLSSATVMSSSQLDFSSPSVLGSLQLGPVTTSSPCTFALTPAFEILVEPPLATVGDGVLSLATSNGSTLLVPVIVNFQSVAACSPPIDAMQCTFVNTSADTIYTCAH